MKKIFFLIFCFVFISLPNFTLADTIISPSEGYINSDTVWTASSSPYFIDGNVYIPAGVTLTLEAGTEARMLNGKKFDVYGVLNVLGTKENKVIFTSQNEGDINDTSGAGRWGGLVFYKGAKGNFNYTKARYAGGNYIFPQPGGPMIYNTGGNVSIKNSELYKTFSTTLYLKSGTTTIENTLINQNSQGIYFEGGYLSLINSTISNSIGQGFGAYNGGQIFLFL